MRLNNLAILLCCVCWSACGLRITPTNINAKGSVVDTMFSKLKLLVPNKALPAILCSALLLANPIDSWAVSSGGRSGGSSFRSSRSYSGAYSGRSNTRLYSGYRSTTIMPMPLMSPFSYGFGFSPFGFMPINGNVLLLAGAAYVAYSLLQNRAGGSDFFSNGETGSLGNGATVVKLQIALDSNWDEGGNIMDTLNALSTRNARDRGIMTGRTELSSLLSEAAITLLRRKDSWSAAAIDGERFYGSDGTSKAEPLFQRMVVQERSKFETETVPPMRAGKPGYSDFVLRRTSMPSGAFTVSQRTQAVVSLLVAIRGQSEALDSSRTGILNLGGRDKTRATSTAEVIRCLQSLASEALTDEGQNVLGVEVLWTPSERGRTLTERDLLLDYPELIKL